MAESASARRERIVETHDKDADKKLDAVELKTAKEVEALGGDVKDVKELRALEKLNKRVEAERKIDEGKKIGLAKKSAEAETEPSTGQKASRTLKKVAVGGAAIGGGVVGIVWAMTKPFRWAFDKMREGTENFLRKNDEIGFIERTDDWFAPHDDKKKK